MRRVGVLLLIAAIFGLAAIPPANALMDSVATKRRLGMTWIGSFNGTGPASSAAILGIQAFTAATTATYTATANTGKVLVLACGSGGGGSGVSNADGQIGSGGSGGGCVIKFYTTAFSPVSYTTGAAGTGGSSGANSGNDGNNTTYKSLIAGKGKGGPDCTCGNIAFARTGFSAVTGTASGGDINMHGLPPVNGFNPTNTKIIGSVPGGALLGQGANGPYNVTNNTTATGASSVDSGSGGASSATIGTGTATAGGDGRPGAIIFLEFP